MEVHPDEWWIQKYELYGFRYDDTLTKQIRRIAATEAHRGASFPPTGARMGAQHVFSSVKVFINPVVAAHPDHALLFATFGGYTKYGLNGIQDIINHECGTGKNGHLETPMSPSFYPKPLTPQQDVDWYTIIGQHLHSTAATAQR